MSVESNLLDRRAALSPRFGTLDLGNTGSFWALTGYEATAGIMDTGQHKFEALTGLLEQYGTITVAGNFRTLDLTFNEYSSPGVPLIVTDPNVKEITFGVAPGASPTIDTSLYPIDKLTLNSYSGDGSQGLTALSVWSIGELTVTDLPLICGMFNGMGITKATLSNPTAAYSFENGINLSGNPLTELSIPDDEAATVGGAFYGDYLFTDCGMSAALVNYILAQLVQWTDWAGADPLYPTIDLSGNAAPTGQGLVDAATLAGLGVTVITE